MERPLRSEERIAHRDLDEKPVREKSRERKGRSRSERSTTASRAYDDVTVAGRKESQRHGNFDPFTVRDGGDLSRPATVERKHNTFAPKTSTRSAADARFETPIKPIKLPATRPTRDDAKTDRYDDVIRRYKPYVTSTVSGSDESGSTLATNRVDRVARGESPLTTRNLETLNENQPLSLAPSDQRHKFKTATPALTSQRSLQDDVSSVADSSDADFVVVATGDILRRKSKTAKRIDKAKNAELQMRSFDVDADAEQVRWTRQVSQLVQRVHVTLYVLFVFRAIG